MKKSGDGQITALVPVYECADRLASHISWLRSLQGTFADFIWVVTPGRDDSARLARKASQDLGGAYLEVPPGLYKAWNTGIRAVGTEFTYISTVGETASAEGLRRLRNSLQVQGADVCFTPPFLPQDAKARSQLLRWPIFRFRRELRKKQGKVLHPLMVAKLQAVAGIFSLLGSCASCLFRTSYLQAHPFPTGYFHYGDAAWVYENYATARMVYLDDPMADFSVHGPSGRNIGPRDVERLRQIILRDLRRMPGTRQAAHALSKLDAASRYLDSKRGRRPSRFWWLNLKLAKARLERSRCEKRFAREMVVLEKKLIRSDTQALLK